MRLTGETADCARAWVEFVDPVEPLHTIRADLTWLCSRWTCGFGTAACQGTVPGAADLGCCTGGASLDGDDDLQRVEAAVAELTDDDWQARGRGLSALGWTQRSHRRDGTPYVQTRLVDGACIFANRSDHPAGAGCALHLLAERTGRPSMETKPVACWRVPMKVQRHDGRTAVGDLTRTTVVTEWSRIDFDALASASQRWWCTDVEATHTAATPFYQRYAGELSALLGTAAYRRLAEIAAEYLAGDDVVPHPASGRIPLPVVPVGGA
jgi:hypothetical protein